MYNPDNFVYVPGDYFGKKIAEKFKIKTETTLIVGCVIKKFNMSGHIWYQVYWFLTNEKLWIDANHLTKLPINSNIIYGKTYLNKLNKINYKIKKDISYFHNLLTNNSVEIKDTENKNNCQDEFRNENLNKDILPNLLNTRYRYFA